MRLLNFGCGTTFHSSWVNLDTAPASPEVIGHDLRRDFPFDRESFDAVYGSHVLEHLDRSDAARLVGDCCRILKPGGIIRLAVPDLETIARLYLASLDGALKGDAVSQQRYDWMMLELFDQTVRTRPGGSMAAYLAGKLEQGQADFVSSRIGMEGTSAGALPVHRFSGFRRAIRRGRRAVARLRQLLAGALAFLAMGNEGCAALLEGSFRRGGEIHQWMYDRYSLGRLLRDAGFERIRTCRAGESEIPGFAGYELEVTSGRERKPDSLYVEARKGSAAQCRMPTNP